MIELSDVHVAILVLTACLVVCTDVAGLLYLLGKKQTLSERFIVWAHRLIFAGLAGMVVTGIILFIPMREYLLVQPNFYVKMMFVLALVVNAFVIGAHMKVASTTPFKLLPQSEKRKLFVSGAISTLSWLGAIFGGIYLF
jgi:uncharacterized membrane protein